MVDSKLLVENLGEESLIAAYGLIPDGMPGSLTKQETAFLKEGNPPKNSKDPFVIQLEYGEDSKLARSLAIALEKIWSQSPFLKVLMKPRRAIDVMKSMFQMSSQVLVGGKGLDYFDGYSILSYFKSTYNSNYFHLKDPHVDQMLDRALQLSDRRERIKAYKDIQLEILQHYHVIPLTFGSVAAGLWGPDLAFVPSHPGGLHTLPMETVALNE